MCVRSGSERDNTAWALFVLFAVPKQGESRANEVAGVLTLPVSHVVAPSGPDFSQLCSEIEGCQDAGTVGPR